MKIEKYFLPFLISIMGVLIIDRVYEFSLNGQILLVFMIPLFAFLLKTLGGFILKNYLNIDEKIRWVGTFIFLGAIVIAVLYITDPEAVWNAMYDEKGDKIEFFVLAPLILFYGMYIPIVVFFIRGIKRLINGNYKPIFE
jgi:hypothetical protein